jgi:hypothetical protein
LNRIACLQAWRGRRGGESAIAEFVSRVAEDMRRAHRRLGNLADLWHQLLPPEIVQCTALTGKRGGVLHVAADSAAVAFQLDRLLREGIESELRKRYGGTLVRIRIRVEPIDPNAPADHRARQAGTNSKSSRTGRSGSSNVYRSPGRRRSRNG